MTYMFEMKRLAQYRPFSNFLLGYSLFASKDCFAKYSKNIYQKTLKTNGLIQMTRTDKFTGRKRAKH